ncbi:MAG: acyl--CoA ligase, partial [Clostridia bacterium]|nr:acyl--CoA ligase [Clostridia bacterium]
LEKGNSKARLIDAYGLTESVSGVCINAFYDLRENSIGLPFPDTEVKVVELGTQNEVACGEVGELCFCGPTRMLGYLNNEEETAKVLQKHEDGKIWVHTGDVGCVDEDGYIYYHQRHSRMLIVAGNNVYPTQIENIINTCRNVDTSCVIGVKGRASVQKIIAVVKPTSMDVDLETLKNEINEICEKNVADYARPQEIVFRDTMPLTAMGKVSFKKLMEEMEGKK